MIRRLFSTGRCRSHEAEYLDTMRNIVETGELQVGRNGTTLRKIGVAMRFSLADGSLPLITMKKLAWRTCLKELLWFISGNTDNQALQDQGVRIWDGNASVEAMRERGLDRYRPGDLGPIYGHQWRSFNAPYTHCGADYKGKGVDQLSDLIDNLRDPEKRFSRRNLLLSWNPCQVDQMALPPCHVIAQFHVTQEDKLTCSMYQRSGDMGLGVPFNIASYSLLTHLLAVHCDLNAHEFIHFIGDAHIYDDHLTILKEQIKRTPAPPPTIAVRPQEDINDYNVSDFSVSGYRPQGKLEMEMRI
ncbi:MAG: thymidylate synthase [Dehalococcoidales bacterium]